MRRFVCVAAVTAGTLATLGVAVALGAFTTEQSQKVVPYNVFTDVTAACQHGQHLAFGGFKTNTKVSFGTGADVWLASAAPNSSATKWTVDGSNVTVVDEGKITSLAYCEKGTAPKVVSAKHIILPSANEVPQKTSVSCPGGMVVVGGGWAAKATTPKGQNVIDIMGLQRTTKSTWQVSVINDSGAQTPVTAYALCRKEKAPVAVSVHKDVHSSATATATATCPKGKSVIFGGMQGMVDGNSGANAYPFAFYLATARSIAVTAGENGVAPYDQVGTVTAIAYCG